jgi:hypothetical protein
MDMPAADDRVTLHLKTNRHVRDRLLGALRAEGITMQDFFEHLMQLLVTQPDLVQEIKGRKPQAPQSARTRAGRPARPRG